MLSVRNSKDERIIGDYAIIKHCKIPIALIIQTFESVTNSYRLYFSSYSSGYCMKEVIGNPNIPCAKTDGKWYGYNLYKKIKTRNTPNDVLQLIPNQEIEIEEYSSITHPLKAYLEYGWVNPSTKVMETHYVYLSDIKKDEGDIELTYIIDNYDLEYCNREAIQEFLIESRLSVKEYFKDYNKETLGTISYLISRNENYLINDLNLDTFIWYSADGRLLGYSSKREFDYLSMQNKNVKVRWDTRIKSLFKEMDESSNKEISSSTKRRRDALKIRGIY